MSNELYHYGVKGMKWGVRKKYEPTGRTPSSGRSSSKDIRSENADELRKRIRSLGDKPGANTKRLIQEQERVDNEIAKTNEHLNQRKREAVSAYAKKHGISDDATLNDLFYAADMHKDIGSTLKNDKTYAELNKKFKSLCDKGEKFYDDDLWNSALVKDLGYKDTKEAHDYVEKLIYGY